MKNSCCVSVPEILLPQATADMSKWAVIACDQHTSDPAYWQELEEYVKDAPSALRLTLPEIYLSDDCSDRIAAIARSMRAYREKGIFRKLDKGFVLVERSTPFSPARFGLVLAVDLEAYSYEAGAKAQIKATEATIVERIPPRLKIRESASIEFPHVMLLYDDREDSVLGALKARRDSLEKLYDFDLNMGGGHIKGYFVPESDARSAAQAFSALADEDGVVFMVGDGNHSLATAKASWEKIKAGLSEEEQKDHPARFALAEAVNIYDDGIFFEAIHRVVKGVDPEKFAAGILSEKEGEAFLVIGGKKRACSFGKDVAGAVNIYDDGIFFEAIHRVVKGVDPEKFAAGILSEKEGEAFLVIGGKKRACSFGKDVAGAVKKADAYIAAYTKANGGEADYIHGEEEIVRITEEQKDSVGILLPKMDKSELFATVKKHGCLPRKTFSMGESAEKRYYIEGKEIVKI